jgi:hypothetical protein
VSFRAIFCSINPDYRLIRMTSSPNYSGLARVYSIGENVCNMICIKSHTGEAYYVLLLNWQEINRVRQRDFGIMMIILGFIRAEKFLICWKPIKCWRKARYHELNLDQLVTAVSCGGWCYFGLKRLKIRSSFYSFLFLILVSLLNM